jgi:hypothetical protein
LSFSLEKKDQKFKADINGPPHLAAAPPPCRPWPAHPTQWSVGVPDLLELSSHVIPVGDGAKAGIYGCVLGKCYAVSLILLYIIRFYT